MKKIVVMIFLIVTTMAHGGESQSGVSPTQMRVETVKQQLLQGGFQEEEARIMTQAMVQAKFSEEQMVQLGKQVSSSSHHRVTIGAMQNKVHEGIAKGVHPAAIVKATERVRERYQYAMHLAMELDQKKQEQLGRAYADCLAAGLTRQDARRLQNALKERHRSSAKAGSRNRLNAETLHTTRDMVRQGISSMTTTHLVGKALQRGYSEEEMRVLRHTFRNSKVEDLEKIANQYRLAIENGVRAGGLKNYSHSGGEVKGSSSAQNGQQNGGSASGGGNEGGGSGSSGSGGSGSGSGGSGGSGGDKGGSGGSGSGGGSGNGGSGGGGHS